MSDISVWFETGLLWQHVKQPFVSCHVQPLHPDVDRQKVIWTQCNNDIVLLLAKELIYMWQTLIWRCYVRCVSFRPHEIMHGGWHEIMHGGWHEIMHGGWHSVRIVRYTFFSVFKKWNNIIWSYTKITFMWPPITFPQFLYIFVNNIKVIDIHGQIIFDAN